VLETPRYGPTVSVIVGSLREGEPGDSTSWLSLAALSAGTLALVEAPHPVLGDHGRLAGQRAIVLRSQTALVEIPTGIAVREALAEGRSLDHQVAAMGATSIDLVAEALGSRVAGDFMGAADEDLGALARELVNEPGRVFVAWGSGRGRGRATQAALAACEQLEEQTGSDLDQLTIFVVLRLGREAREIDVHQAYHALAERAPGARAHGMLRICSRRIARDEAFVGLIARPRSLLV
jgi:hypothetical protein